MIQRCGMPACDGKTRCADCRKKRREAKRTRVKYRQMMLAENPDLRPHGEAETYNGWGCRCRECRRAATLNRYRWDVGRGSILTERQEGLRGNAKPFGREWVDAVS